jgi:RND family efflux transporter MFP subunit
VRSFSGTSQAADEPRLSFKVPGTVVRLPVTMGDAVKPGDVIAELDPQDFRLQADEAAATLGRAEAEARNAQANFERVRGLYENTNASRTDFDAARAAAESTRAAVESARKRLELARQQLSYTVLTAPVAGSVAETLVEVNENVHAGQEVVRLAVRSDLKVLVAVPESLIAQVKRGAEVTVRFDALPDRALKAVVTEVGVVATATGTAFPVRARLLETDPALRPGMAAAVELRFAAPGEGTRFRVPPNAVAEDRAGRYVLVVEPSGADRGVVRRRAVKVGDLTPGGLEILEGLRDGDRLVTAGVSRLTDGDPVKLPSEG